MKEQPLYKTPLEELKAVTDRIEGFELDNQRKQLELLQSSNAFAREVRDDLADLKRSLVWLCALFFVCFMGLAALFLGYGG